MWSVGTSRRGVYPQADVAVIGCADLQTHGTDQPRVPWSRDAVAGILGGGTAGPAVGRRPRAEPSRRWSIGAPRISGRSNFCSATPSAKAPSVTSGSRSTPRSRSPSRPSCSGRGQWPVGSPRGRSLTGHEQSFANMPVSRHWRAAPAFVFARSRRADLGAGAPVQGAPCQRPTRATD